MSGVLRQTVEDAGGAWIGGGRGRGAIGFVGKPVGHESAQRVGGRGTAGGTGIEETREDGLVNGHRALGHSLGRELRGAAIDRDAALGEVVFQLGPGALGRASVAGGNGGGEVLEILVDGVGRRAGTSRGAGRRSGELGIGLDDSGENGTGGGQIAVLDGIAEIIKAALQRGALRQLGGVTGARGTGYAA